MPQAQRLQLAVETRFPCSVYWLTDSTSKLAGILVYGGLKDT